MGKSTQLRWSCGIGDAITYAARIENFKKTHQIDNLHIYVTGGWQNTTDLIIEIFQPCIKSGLISSISTEEVNVDYKEDWQPDNNPLIYPMSLPFEFPTYTGDDCFDALEGKICLIHPCTSQGNGEGFTPGRYLNPEGWGVVCKRMKELGYKVIQIGGLTEVNYLKEVSEHIDINLCGINTLRESIALLKKCDFCIGSNSWPWEISSYAGRKTICLYFSNMHWIYLHALKGYTPGKIFDPTCGIANLRIELNKNVDQILKYIEELHGQ